ncbi:hypothetical protein F511_08904 [Dorcoceras hygrometricum]|uniref:Protein RTE1-HOMOLOG n=1 Tax=Dorcoceras hygrometricum TaxID=472368 RepID=A0A2Z7B2U5_9LAMI|nr:hypothetical protein F511_08904 [Dorcoceras hygrometricum]
MRSNGEPDHRLMIEQDPGDSVQIDPKSSRFPCCIVWSPLPLLSCLFPCIGHVGICREDGVILDFAGPNFVCVDNFTFGSPTRYIQLNREQCYSSINSLDHESEDESMENGGGSDILTWDDALRKSTQEYQHHSYNLFTCNCHSFVANCLNRLKFQTGGWNVVNLAILIFLKGQWVSKIAIMRTYLPFFLLVGLGLLFGGATFLTYLAIFVFIIVGWFLLGTYCFKKLIQL